MKFEMLKKISFVTVIILLSSFLMLCSVSCDETKDKPNDKETEETMEEKTPDPKVELKTNMGNIIIELNPARAPVTVENFLNYVNSGFYDGTIFHRVIKGFMVQGGGFNENMVEKQTNPPIENEASNGLKNLRGTIAMARKPQPDSASCQFFINHKDNTNLDYTHGNPGYAVFGKVLEGMEVVDKIANAKTGVKIGTLNTGTKMRLSDVPLETVIIESAKIVKE